MRVVLFDCGSSSTPELRSALLRAGASEVLVLRPFEGPAKGEAYVFSGRARKSKDVDRWAARLMKELEGERVLLVCYSAELFNLLKGGRLARAEPVEGLVEVEFLRPSPLWPRAERVKFYESRAYRISGLGKGLEVLAKSERMGVEAYRFEEFYGVLFHPEMSGENGLALLSGFLEGRG